MVANFAATQITSSAIVVLVIQKLKTAKWFPLVAEGKATANRVLSIVGAALTALAVNYAWSWNAGSRQFVFTLTIPTLPIFALAMWHWLNHFALQEIIYQATANKLPAAPIAQKG